MYVSPLRIGGIFFAFPIFHLQRGGQTVKLIRFGDAGKERPGILLSDSSRLDASGFGSDYNEEFFAGNGLIELERWLGRSNSTASRIDPNVRLGPPICRPSKIVCIGLNYRSHAAEADAKVPSEPVLFLKATTALSGPNDDVVMPRDATKVDYEVELAVIVGKKASYVPKERALEFVAGYTIMNDYSERAFQLERSSQWTKGKSADTFAPLGPFLATRDEIRDPNDLEFWLTVNGQIRQKSNTVQMVFDVPILISSISHYMTLLPGDVVSTGTPSGVGLGMKPPVYLKPGDIVEQGIDLLGTARQSIVAPKA